MVNPRACMRDCVEALEGVSASMDYNRKGRSGVSERPFCLGSMGICSSFRASYPSKTRRTVTASFKKVEADSENFSSASVVQYVQVPPRVHRASIS